MSEIKNTLGKDRRFGKGYDDVGAADLERGYFDAAPEGNYEGSLAPAQTVYDFETGEVTEKHVGTMHPGKLEPDGFVRTHGDQDQYGFVRRPMYRSDVER